MFRFIVKRVLSIVPTLLVISFLVYSLVSLTPSNPGRIKLGINAPDEAVQQVNHELGYDKPFFGRYFGFLGNSLKGDFGTSYYTGKPVVDEIKVRLPRTATLAFSSLLVMVLVGIPLGVFCAVRQYSGWDRVFSTTAMFLSAIPGFWLGLMLMLLFSLKLGWLPSGGVTRGFVSWILPVTTLSLGSVGGYIRFTRSAMLETIREDYIRTARAKGCVERRVIWKHAFGNALLTLVTITGMSCGYLLGGSLITESVFSIPGLGVLVLTSIRRKDIPLVLSAIMMISLIFLTILLVIDILYAVIDPRIKAAYQYASAKKKKQSAGFPAKPAAEGAKVS